MRQTTAAIAAVLLAGTLNASAFDPKDILNGLRGGSSGADTTQTETTNDSESKGGLGGLLGGLGSFINNAAANKKFSVDDLVGSWKYTSPAVSFQSSNALKKIGGAGAATAVEDKLSPYYDRLGFNRSSLTVDAEHNFTLKMGVLTLKGKIEKDPEDDMLVFNFNAFNKIALGKVKANATKAGSTLNLTFDATKMVQLLTKVSSVLNVSTLNTLASILNSYDGIYMGFKFKAER